MRALLLSVLLVTVAAKAWAGCASAPKPANCGFEWDAAKLYPDEAKKFAAGSAVYSCRQGGAVFMTPVVKGEADVCYYWSRDMDIDVPKNQYPKRALMMRLAEGGACPRQDDDGYVENQDVPDGVFAALLTLWNARSLDGLDAGTKADRKRFTLGAVSVDRAYPEEDCGIKRGSRYLLSVADAQKKADTDLIYVDWRDGAFRVVGEEVRIPGC